MHGGAAGFGILFGSMASLGVARSRYKLARAADGLFMSPLVLAALTFGVPTLMYLTLIGIRPSINLIIAGLTVPLIIRMTSASISQLDPALNDSSQSLGASWFSPCAA